MASPTYTRKTFVDGNTPALNAANLNITEAFLDALQTYLVPTGSGMDWYTSTAPTGWLLCDGAAVSRTTYSGLFAVIGTQYGSGDGSSTFNVPNGTEAVYVGIGTRASGVTAHDTYTLGQFKDDQSHDHAHVPSSTTTTNRIIGRQTGGSAIQTGTDKFVLTGDTVSSATFYIDLRMGQTELSGSGTPRTGTTTHGKQIGVNRIIKT